jgi:putative membrane protein
MSDNKILIKASFDEKVKTYIFLVVIFYLIITVFGIALLPVWLLGFGQWVSNKFYHTLKCELSEKNLYFSKGLILHIEKTIPLENIQDLSFIGGPVLRAFGLTIIKVETAGGGGTHQSNMMSMIGIVDADNFKSAILNQREIRLRERNKMENGNTQISNGNDTQLLSEIRDELKAIKTILKEKN